MTSPRDLTLAAFRSGAVTRRAIVASTGLDPDVVDLIVDTLVRSGDIDVLSPKLDCGPGGCLGCWQSIRCRSTSGESSKIILSPMPLMPN